MAEKTNFGSEFNKIKHHKNMGNPNLSDEKIKLGTIIDIRMPSREDQGKGMQCRIAFDGKPLTYTWYTLEDDYMKVLATIGDKESVVAAGVRVMYTCHPSDPKGGIAKIICDNKEENKFKAYEKNRSLIVTGAFNGLASGTKPIGIK